MRVKSDEEFHRIRIILKGGKKIKIKKYEKVNQNACKKRHKRVKYTELKNVKELTLTKRLGCRQAVRLRTLTPSSGSSNLSTPATKISGFTWDFLLFTACLANAVYGWIFPKMGKLLGKVFGVNFCFLNSFLIAFTDKVVFVFFNFAFLLGKILSVIYLFGFLQLKFIGIMSINRCGYRSA